MPEQGYDVQTFKMPGKGKYKYCLVHTKRELSVEIGPPDQGDEWEIFLGDEDEREYIWQRVESDYEHVLCSDMMNELLAAEASARIGQVPVKDAPTKRSPPGLSLSMFLLVFLFLNLPAIAAQCYRKSRCRTHNADFQCAAQHRAARQGVSCGRRRFRGQQQ